MVNPYRFYTYAYLRKDKTPYYIGKGQRKRIYDVSGKPCGIPKDKSRIIFLKQNLTEDEAFKHEQYMISVFGRKDIKTGILHNRTNGGDGASGVIRSEETKQKMSKALKGRIFTEEHRKNIGETSRGRKHTEETRRKMCEKRKGNKPSLGMKHSENYKNRLKKEMLGKGNHFYGKTHTKKVKEKLSSMHNKFLCFVSPSGEIVEEFTTLRKFCKKYNLCRSNLDKLMSGKQKQHKGWTFLKKDDKMKK